MLRCKSNRSSPPARAAAKSVKSSGAGPLPVEPLETRRLMSVLPVGGAIALTGTTYAARPELGGVVIRDDLVPVDVTDSAGTTVFKGALQDRVVKENLSGTLDFYQTLRADPGMPSPAFIEFARRISFAGCTTDVDYRTDGLGVPSLHPLMAQRPAPGAEVSFQFGQNGLIDPGTQTLFYFVKTNATDFDVNGKTELAFMSPPGALFTTVLQTAEPIAPQHPTTGNIVGSVFADWNANGKRDLGEGGLSGWTVDLNVMVNGQMVQASTTTDASGDYSFSNLAPGTYQISEVVKPGWARTAPLAASTSVTVMAGSNAAGPVFGDAPITRIRMGFDMLVNLARHYNQSGTFADGDLNGDGTVDFQDFVTLARHYNGFLDSPAA